MEDIKEKTADELFVELGYRKSSKPFDRIKYYKDDDNVFYFDYISQEFIKSGEYDGMCDGINMQELKAINKKCKELGWI